MPAASRLPCLGSRRSCDSVSVANLWIEAPSSCCNYYIKPLQRQAMRIRQAFRGGKKRQKEKRPKEKTAKKVRRQMHVCPCKSWPAPSRAGSLRRPPAHHAASSDSVGVPDPPARHRVGQRGGGDRPGRSTPARGCMKTRIKVFGRVRPEGQNG